MASFWAEQSHKLRWQELLIQQVLIRILGLMGETVAISLSMNDFYGEKQRVMENAAKERIFPSYGSLHVPLCVPAALPEAHGGK